jgi:predicted DNA-binding transcriptional regulator AlpA
MVIAEDTRAGVHLRARLGLVTQEELADMLDVSTDTLREWRRLRQGPDFVKTGKGVMYREADVQDWLKRNVVPVVRA